MEQVEQADIAETGLEGDGNPTDASSETSEQALIITFDQAHGNLMDVSSTATDDQSFSQLISLLQETGFVVDEPITDTITPLSLSGKQIFVLAAPTERLTGDEINFIWRFVQNGGGLLLLNNGTAVQQQVFSLNTLAERAGCRFGFYAANEPLTLKNLAPHYISENVNEVRLSDTGQQNLSRITFVESESNLNSLLGNGYSEFLMVGTCQQGRLIVAGNTAMFSNEHLEKSDNQRFVSNIFRWLAGINPFEIDYLTPDREVELGQSYVFEMGLFNPTNQSTKIKEIILESSVNDQISRPSVQDIVLYPDKDKNELQRLRWEIQPQEVLGDHHLRLCMRYDQTETVYRRVSTFTIGIPGHTRLEVRKKKDDPTPSIFVGETFEVSGKGTVSSLKEKSVTLTPVLEYPTEQIRIIEPGSSSELQWNLSAKAAGTFPITLAIKETGQIIQTYVVIKESEASQIEAITTRFVNPLDDEIRRILPDLSSALTLPELAQVPFKILTIEDYISIALPFEPAAQQVWDVVEAGFWEEVENETVVADLLYNLAPMYMPRYGAFVPFAPELVNRLVRAGTSRRRELVVNFLKDDRVTDVQVRRQIASYVSHEKYGHGFFYTCTKLGQQLAILDKHKFLDKYATHILGRPYPNKLYEEYEPAIKILQHSSLIANEGIASWLELKILDRLGSDIEAIIPERKQFMAEAQTLRDVRQDSVYFDEFPGAAGLDSPYEEGRQYLENIEQFYPKEYGIKCAIQAFLVATWIPLGINDGGEAPDFALSPEVIKIALLQKEGNDARSDLRLWRITRVLEDTKEIVRETQERLQCHAVCLHPECPVKVQIFEKLGWRIDDE